MRFTNHVRRAAFTLLLLAGVIAAAGPSLTAGAQTARRPKANGRIVYQSARNNQNEIFVMDADGKNIVQLTDNTADDQMPSWSPDGTKIAFVSRRDQLFGEIYVMNVDGGNVVRLTQNEKTDYDPVWSPDGKRIVFTSYRDNNAEIYVMNADGTNQTRLTTNPGDDTEAAWSPDGSRIVLTSVQNGNTDIYVMNSDGTNQTRLTDDPAIDKSPSWSPSGVSIVFVSGRYTGSEIFMMSADGSNENILTYNLTGSQFDPEYAPDGEKLTFVSNGEGEPEIFTADAYGNSPVRLTNNPTYDLAPSWQPLNVNGKITFSSARDGVGDADVFTVKTSGDKLVNLTKTNTANQRSAPSPDGTLIAFDSFRNSNFDIYVMSADGTNLKRLTTSTASDTAPAWSPDGKRIAFTSERDGNREIYVMNADGTSQVRVTNNLADDSFPSWSLSGTQLAFQSNRDAEFEIFVINVDGTGEKELAAGNATHPKWSPDGSRIAFNSSRDGDNDIFVMTADGKNPVNLTKSVGGDVYPAWSPDATRIAFSSFRDGNWEIYTMNADGSGQSRLTTEGATDEEPSWKTVGIYFISGRVSTSGAGLAGVSVNLTSPSVVASGAVAAANESVVSDGVLLAVTNTDSNGVFTFNWLEEDQTYIVTPVKATYTFNPTKHVLADLNASKFVSFGALISSYTISGKVTDGQFPMAGLTVKLTGSKNASTLTDPDGNYSFTVLAGGNYTVTPAYPNYTFTPASRVYNALSGSQSDQNFAGKLNAHTIGGVVKLGMAGLGGVTVTLTSPSESFTPRKATTDVTGAYSFAGLPAGRTYTVTPAKTHYTFTPASRTYAGLSANQPASNFGATLNTYTVGGTIKVGTTALAGVTLTLTSPAPAGFAPRTTTTSSTGAYLFGNVPAGRTYVVTPAKLHYTFTPATRTYSNLSASQTAANFAATLKTYSIAGTITVSGTSTGLYQVALTIASPTAGFAPRTVYTNTAGAYNINGLPAGRGYTVTPAKLNYTFSPAVRSYASLGGNIVGQNFSATLKTYTVSGLITKAGTTTGIASVAVTITSPAPAGFAPRTVQTNLSGVYTVTGLPAGRTYVIKPVKSGFTFTPLTKTVTNLGGNVAAGSLTNFTGVQ
ncbi:MAG TPA: carboxypeptidase regulatory-like domain-containing protein [Pyrinomonadaceae bacterium]|nr:carboxypeptidase regulatory-like domain-containing protein [Pyrinomonadaceae bacterium]